MIKFRVSRPLLQLIRPPNLFTVPGDPLCGALLASHGAWSWRILPAMLASLACYCFGLVLNDLVDFKEDLRERPGRPLASAAVSTRTALGLALIFFVAALALSQLLSTRRNVTFLLLWMIVMYNAFKATHPAGALLLMGICRGLSVLVGVAAIGPLHLLPLIFHPFFPAVHFPPPPLAALCAAGAIAAYIAGVTALARNETGNPRIPPLIGSLIRALLFLQAGFCLLAGGCGWIAALLLLALWPASRLVAAHFYAS